MTKSELAPYLDAVTNEERTFLICQTSEGAYIGESSPTCDDKSFVLPTTTCSQTSRLKLFRRLPYFVFNIIVHPNTE